MYRIIVADDEEELRRAIIRRIQWEEIGFQVVGEAENGAEALELVEKLEPDLVLTDIRMPFISGIELARQIREVRPATQIAFLSGYDEFTYAQQAIQYNIISYLLKPISMVDLTKELRVMKEKLDRIFREFVPEQKGKLDAGAFLMPLLLDEYREDPPAVPEEELLERAGECGLIEPGAGPFCWVVMTTAVRGRDGKNCTGPEHVAAIDSILKKYMKFFSFYGGDKIVSLLMGTQGGFDKYLHIAAENIIQSVDRILALNGCVGVSRVTGRLSDCHQAYREAVDAMGYARKNGSGIHFISDEEPFRARDIDLEKRLETDLIRIVRAGTLNELEQYLEQARQEDPELAGNREQLREIATELYASVGRMLTAVSGIEKVRQSKESYEACRRQFDETVDRETWKALEEFCSASWNIVADQRKKSSQVFCERALEMIDREFGDAGLSLSRVSGAIGVSPNYLSALMKKETGKTFIDLLTQKRIETAKNMLLRTPMKIRDISEQCGYSDQHYFSYCFKKYTGQSPNALRRQGGETL